MNTSEDIDATQYWKKVLYQVWYEDPGTLPVASVTTRIEWGFNGQCVLWGTGYGQIHGYAPTGWYAVPGSFGYREGTQCGRYFGKTFATLQNDSFCRDRVSVWFYYVTARGAYNGYHSGSNSTAYSADTACAPLFKHVLLRVEGSGEGGPT